MGGSSGPLGVRAAGALDGEVAYLLGAGAGQATRCSPAGRWIRRASCDITRPRGAVVLPAHADGWTALLEAAAKAVRGLVVSVPAPHEIVVSGRLARLPELVAALAASLDDIAPVIRSYPGRASAAAHGGALLADALAGGRNADLAEVLRLREASGTALDHLRVAGAEAISLG